MSVLQAFFGDGGRLDTIITFVGLDGARRPRLAAAAEQGSALPVGPLGRGIDGRLVWDGGSWSRSNSPGQSQSLRSRRSSNRPSNRDENASPNEAGN
jgi:hypothetical protein